MGYPRCLRIHVIRFSLIVMVMFSVNVTIAPSFAQTTTGAATSEKDAPEVTYRQHKQRGDELFVERRYEDALAAYTQAYEVLPNPVLHYNRASALDALSRFPEALDFAQRFDREASSQVKAKVPALQDFIAELRNKTGLIVIQCAEVKARVFVAGIAVVSPFAPLRLNRGRVRVEAFLDGADPLNFNVELAGNATLSVPISFVQRSASLSIKGTRPGTRFALDGADLGVGPVQVQTSAGKHQLTSRLDGFLDATATVVLTAGEVKSVTLDPTPRRSLLQSPWLWLGVSVVALAAGVSIGYVALSTERGAPTGSGFSPSLAAF
jgi:hypothetical protein